MNRPRGKFKNNVIKMFNPRSNRRGSISKSKLVLDLRTMAIKKREQGLLL